VSSSAAFLSGDWRKSQIFIRYPGGLRVRVNGHAGESWRVEHEGTAHDLPPFGWLAVGTDGFYECSGVADGKRYDRARTPQCIFLDGRGTWRQFDGIGTAGSVAVRRAKEGQCLSIITIDGVERLVIGKPQGTFGPEDVRTAVTAVARSQAIVVQAFDSQEKDLGEVATRQSDSGWEMHPPRSTVRLEVRVK
jgi:hypothetical protein